MTAHAVQNVRSRQEWAEIINADWRKSIESIIQTGRDLITAKGELAHGEFTKMIELDLPFSERTAERLMRVANHPAIGNAAPAPSLPPSWTVLAELAKLSEADFDDAREHGLISEKTNKREARAISGAYKVPVGSSVGEGTSPSMLPTPTEARRVARETGRLVSASDGNLYSGATEEEGEEYVRERDARFRAIEAIQTLSNLDMTPHEWLHEAKPHWLVDFSLHDLEGAMMWLGMLHDDYCRKERIIDNAQ